MSSAEDIFVFESDPGLQWSRQSNRAGREAVAAVAPSDRISPKKSSIGSSLLAATRAKPMDIDNAAWRQTPSPVRPAAASSALASSMYTPVCLFPRSPKQSAPVSMLTPHLGAQSSSSRAVSALAAAAQQPAPSTSTSSSASSLLPSFSSSSSSSSPPPPPPSPSLSLLLSPHAPPSSSARSPTRVIPKPNPDALVPTPKTLDTRSPSRHLSTTPSTPASQSPAPATADAQNGRCTSEEPSPDLFLPATTATRVHPTPVKSKNPAQGALPQLPSFSDAPFRRTRSRSSTTPSGPTSPLSTHASPSSASVAAAGTTASKASSKRRFSSQDEPGNDAAAAQPAAKSRSTMASPVSAQLNPAEQTRKKPRSDVDGNESDSQAVVSKPVKGKGQPTSAATLKPTQVIERLGCLRRALLLSSVPDHVACRESEQESILAFWQSALRSKAPGALYISGAPGTGKSASVAEIARGIHGWEQKKGLLHARVISINCMTLKDPFKLYEALLCELLNKKVAGTPATCLHQLEQELLFSSSRKAMVVFIIDEIDQLETKAQEVLYKLFEWPTIPQSRVVLIGIANALDLVDRTLKRLKAKNCMPLVLNFPPYDASQITAVINERLAQADKEFDGDDSQLQLIDPIAIQFCAGKVASASGDVRKALDIFRRAVEITEVNAKAKLSGKEPLNAAALKIDISLIANISNDVFGSKEVARLQAMPLHQKLLLCTLLASFRNQQAELGKIYDAYTQTCKGRNITAVTWNEFCDLCMALENSRVVVSQHSKEKRKSKLSLNIQHEDVAFALKDTPIVRTLLDKIERSAGKGGAGIFDD